MRPSLICRSNKSPLKFAQDLVQLQVEPLATKAYDKTIHIKGPLGQLSLPLQPFIGLDIQTTDRTFISVSIKDEKDKFQRSMLGTARALLKNMVQGVTEGYDVTVTLVGVGYKAALEKNTLSLRLGFCHPIDLPVPDGIQVKIISPQKLVLSGVDLQKVTQFAASIRRYRPPEPYNQKGVFVGNETIKKKEGKKR